MSFVRKSFPRKPRFAVEDVICGVRVLEVIAEPGAFLTDVTYRLLGLECDHEFTLSHKSLMRRRSNNVTKHAGYCPQCCNTKGTNGRFKGLATNPETPAKSSKTSPSTASWAPTSGKLSWQ